MLAHLKIKYYKLVFFKCLCQVKKGLFCLTCFFASLSDTAALVNAKNFSYGKCGPTHKPRVAPTYCIFFGMLEFWPTLPTLLGSDLRANHNEPGSSQFHLKLYTLCIILNSPKECWCIQPDHVPAVSPCVYEPLSSCPPPPPCVTGRDVFQSRHREAWGRPRGGGQGGQKSSLRKEWSGGGLTVCTNSLPCQGDLKIHSFKLWFFGPPFLGI